MDAPARIYVRPKSSKEGANYTRDDLCADPALLAEAVEVLRMVDAWGHGLRHHTSHESKMVKSARAFLAKLENRQ